MTQKIFAILLSILFITGIASAQKRVKRTPVKPTPKAAQSAPAAIDRGSVSGRTYTNNPLGFTVTFPDTWLIPGDDFEEYMKKQGFDLSLKAPEGLPRSSKKIADLSAAKLNIVLTAYRSMPGTPENAIVRISLEDLSANPQIKDAVDYFDAVRASYAAMKLPRDFNYSATQVEKLGSVQFGYLDASSSAGKKRLYGTVKGRMAILFSISYTSDDDLQTLRELLAHGDFGLREKN